MKKTITTLVTLALLLFAPTSVRAASVPDLVEVIEPSGNQPLVELIRLIKSQEEITQVVRIATDGEEELEVLSLSTQGYKDFLMQYPGNDITISNLEMERIFHFMEVEWDYPEDIISFLEKDKDSLSIIHSQFPDNARVFFGNGFLLSYVQGESWQNIKYVELFLEDSESCVTYRFDGATNAKKLYYSCDYGTEFLMFELNDNLYAINEEMSVFKLDPK